MKKIFCLFLLYFLCVCRYSYSQDLPDPETRGVWITANYIKETSAIESLVKKLSDANFNTLFVDTWYSGATIYPSSVVGNAGGPLQQSEFSGTDPLRTVIDIAHKYKMEVFAWMEFGMAVGYGYSTTDAPSIIKKHPDWSMVSRDDKIAEADPWGGYLFWVDPSVNSAADFMVGLYTEVVEKYPDIDGIELDRMRYPYIDFSYSDTSRAKFIKETGYPDPLSLSDEHAGWADWRRQQVTNVVRRIYSSVKSINPQCIITGAVVPPYMMYGGDDKLQAWDVWAKKSYVDILEPMLYLPTSDYSYQLNLCKNYVPNGFQLAPGIDINSAGSIANAISEIKTTRTANMAGEIIWYYGYLLSSTNALSEIKSSVYTSKTSPTHNDLIIDNAAKGSFSTTGTWSNVNMGYKGLLKKSSGAIGDTAIYSVRILREGNYSLYGYWGGDSITNSNNVNVLLSNGNISKLNFINQQQKLNKWNLVDVFHFSSGDTVTIKLFGSEGVLIADAFRLKLNPLFSLVEYIMNDNQTLLVKFTNNLLNPLSTATKITSSITSNLNFFVNDNDNTILQINMESIKEGEDFIITIENLLDIDYDTLNLCLNITYNPDETEVVLDDSGPNTFWKLSGTWQKDTNYTAIENTFWFAKQSDKTARVQWGPSSIFESGYYDVFARIPKINIPLTDECLYIIKDRDGIDTINISQDIGSNNWLKLGNFRYVSGDIFSIILSSVTGADTNKYLVADAIMIKRALETTYIIVSDKPGNFHVYQNYPNPFNPITTISYSLSKESFVSLKIYNCLGELVNTLESEVKNSGLHSVRWNGSDFTGRTVTSGIYIARIEAEGKSKSIKLILMK